MHVPAKNDGAEAEASLCDGEELGLGHQLAAQDAVDVDTADLDCGIILQQLGQTRDGDFGWWRRHGGRLLKKLGSVSREGRSFMEGGGVAAEVVGGALGAQELEE